MAKAIRTIHSDETKRKAVRDPELLAKSAPVGAIVEKYGLSSSSLLYTWKAAGWGAVAEPTSNGTATNGTTPNGHSTIVSRTTFQATSTADDGAVPPVVFEEVRRLKAENAELRSLLKKLL